MALVLKQTYEAIGSDTNRSYITAGIDYVLESQDIENNKSTIRIFPWIRTTRNGSNSTWNLNQRISTAMVGNQSKTSGTKFDLRNATTNTKLYLTSSYPFQASSVGDLTAVGSKYGYQFTVSHNADGTLTGLKLYCIVPTNNLAGSLDSTVDILVDLPTIPRASDLTCDKISTIGGKVTCTIGKKSDNFTSTLTYQIESLTGTIATKDSRKTIDFDTAPIKSNIYALIPNDRDIKGKVYCQTYNGNTPIGDLKMAEFTLNIVESDCKPSISTSIKDKNDKTKELTNDELKIIKGVSIPEVTIYATPKFSANIASYEIKWNQNYNVNTKMFYNGVYTSNLETVIVDTRGIRNAESINLDSLDRWIDYEKLTINKLKVERTESTSNIITCEMSGSYFKNSICNVANTLSLRYRYREQYGEWSDYISLSPTISTTKHEYLYSHNNLRTDIDFNKNYEFEFEISDKLMTITSQIIQITKGKGIVEIGEEFVNINGELYVNDQPIGGGGIDYNSIYPVGSIYMSVNNTNPSTLFGGTWEQIKDRFLLASGNSYANGTTGGSASVTLATNHLPSHNHSFTGTSHAHSLNGHTHGVSALKVNIGSSGAHTHTGRYKNGYSPTGNNFLLRRVSDDDGYTGDATVTYNGGAHAHTGYISTDPKQYTDANWSTTEWISAGGTVGNTGSGVAHNNMPPYLAIFVWKRTA